MKAKTHTMTLELELSPQTEARLRADAAARRTATAIATQAVEAFVSPFKPSADAVPMLPKGQRRAAIQAGRGSMRGLLSSDRLLAERDTEARGELEKDRQTVWPQRERESGAGASGS
jgi:hypothetical protein